jgi:type II secretory pathway pseudopilin PulG
MKGHLTSAFSLVEVTLALGIAAFCLIAVFGLLPVGMQTNRNAKSQSRATNLMAAVMADLRSTPRTTNPNPTSLQFCIPLSGTTTIYFDSEGRCSSDPAGSVTRPCVTGTSWVPPLDTRYRVNIITFPSNGNLNLTYADLKVTWPAPADPATTTPSGSVEMFAAFDRY